jgi:hypothetical protein
VAATKEVENHGPATNSESKATANAPQKEMGTPKRPKPTAQPTVTDRHDDTGTSARPTSKWAWNLRAASSEKRGLVLSEPPRALTHKAVADAKHVGGGVPIKEEKTTAANRSRAPLPEHRAPVGTPKLASLTSASYTSYRAPTKTTTTAYFPTNDPRTAIVKLSATSPNSVYAGENADYIYSVKNLTDCALNDVGLRLSLGNNYELVGSSPRAMIGRSGAVRIDLDRLEGQAERKVLVRVKTRQPGSATICAEVDYSPEICVRFVAVAPKLVIDQTLPAKALLGDEVPVKVVVGNSGTGIIKGAEARCALPAGLVTSDGSSTVILDVGELPGGKCKTMLLKAKAVRVGTFTNKFLAKAGELEASDTATIDVTATSL